MAMLVTTLEVMPTTSLFLTPPSSSFLAIIKVPAILASVMPMFITAIPFVMPMPETITVMRLSGKLWHTKKHSGNSGNQPDLFFHRYPILLHQVIKNLKFSCYNQKTSQTLGVVFFIPVTSSRNKVRN